MRRAYEASRWAVALIITVVAGCDNVEWGGTHVAVVPPPPKGDEPAGELGRPAAERLPEGPVLYYVRPAGGRATLVPVAEIGRESLLPIRPTADPERYARRFIAEHLREGSEFALFRSGARVGTLVLQSASLPAEGVCPRVPRGTGVLELVSDAERIPEFLALSKAQAPADAPRRATPLLEPDRRMQLLAPILAERLLRARGTPLPGNWMRAMAQLKPFPLRGAADPAFTATFLVDDTLGPGSDDVGYSLFFIGVPETQVGYDTAYVHFTDYPTEGKAAPRLVDFLDWDRDDEVELFLEVSSTQGSWFEALDRSNAGWRRVMENPCPRPRPAAPPPAEATKAQPVPPQRRTPAPTRAPEPEPAPRPLELPSPQIELARPPGTRPTVRPDTTPGG